MSRIRARKKMLSPLMAVVTFVTFVVPLLATGGTVFKDKNQIIAEASWFGGDYDSLAVELAGATAFADARDDFKLNDGGWSDVSGTFGDNLTAICDGEHFGNVGIFIGPRGTSKNSDMWSILLSGMTVTDDQIAQFDSMINGTTNDGPFTKYKLFGGAVQKLNDRAMKSKGATSSAEHAMLSLSNVSSMLTNVMVTIFQKYDPTPVVNALVDYSSLATHSTNSLCKLILDHPDACGFFEMMGTSSMAPGIPNSLFMLAVLAMLMLGISALMTIINGRTAGEGVRKVIWKIGIAIIGIPVFLNASSWLVGSLGSLTEEGNEEVEGDFIRKNLDFADWYATGFNLPTGMTLAIDEDGEFVFTQADIEAINKYAHNQIYGTDDAEAIETTIKNYYTQYKSTPMEISFAEPVDDGEIWNSKDYYKMLDSLGSNKDVKDGLKGSWDDIKYINENGLSMTIDHTTGGASITSSDKRFGISPIAATNLMRTSFAGSKMSLSDKADTMGSVAFNAYNSEDSSSAKMPVLIRFITTIMMTVAAIKGIIKVFAAGFMGMIGGGAKTALGSSQGFGQMLGGLVAIILSLLTTGIIMTLTMAFLNNMYGLINTAFNAVMFANIKNQIAEDPVKSCVNMFGLRGLPFLTDIFVGGFAKLVTIIMAWIMLPKLSRIPIQAVSEKLAELPDKFASRAQEIENRFTGDYRAGGGGGSSTMSMINNMVSQSSNQASSQGRAILQGAGTAAGAVGGYALGKAGTALGEKYADKSMNSESDSNGASSGENPVSGEAGISADAATEATAATATEAAMAGELNENGENRDTGTNATGSEAQAGSASDTSANDTTASESGTDNATGEASATSSEASGNGNAAPVVVSSGSESSMSEAPEASDTNIEEGNQISETSRESINDESQESMSTENNEHDTNAESMSSSDSASSTSDLTETDATSDVDSMSDVTSDTTMASDTMASDSSVSDQNSVSDVANNNESSSMSQTASDSRAKVDSHASATVSSSNSTMTAKGRGSASQTAGTGSSNTHVSSGGSTVQNSNGSTHVSGGGSKIGSNQSVNNTHTATMNGKGSTGGQATTAGRANAPVSGTASTSSQNLSSKAMTKEQKHAKNMRAIAKGLQAAGGNTTKKQMIAGVMAGTAHMAGGMVGAQNVTQKGINAVREDKARQRDIAAGNSADFTRKQREREEAMANIARTMEQHETPVATNPNTYSSQTVSNNAYYAEELARQQYEDNVARRHESSSDD